MALFHVQRNLFGRTAESDDDEEDNGTGLPSPKLLKVNARRMAGIKEGKEVLTHWPAPGESLHVVCTHRLDIACPIGCLLERCGTCDRLLIATLSYHERNLKLMLDWLGAGAVKTLTLLTSIFFRSHKGALWEHTLAEFRARGQRAAAVHSHAKVVCLEFASGVKLVIHGSANLAGNGSGREQFALENSADLHDWHRVWILDQVERAEAKANESSGSAARTGSPAHAP